MYRLKIGVINAGSPKPVDKEGSDSKSPVGGKEDRGPGNKKKNPCCI